MLSTLALPPYATPRNSDLREPKATYGFKPFRREGKVVSNEVIDELRDRGDT